jgi:hypothetical protein
MKFKLILTNHPRELILIYLSVAYLSLILLAGSMGEMELKQGLPIPGASTNNPSPSDQSITPSSSINKNPINPILLETVIGIGILILLVLIIYSLAKKINKRKIGIMVVGLIGLMIVFNLLNRIQPTTDYSNVDQGTEFTVPLSTDPEIVFIEKPPSQMLWLVGSGLLLAAFSFVFYLFLRERQGSHLENALVHEANIALQAIREGKDLRNIIINCYLQFNLIIKEELEIEREKSMTAREFEISLLDKGIPIESIHQLTTLFEKVRYGNKPTDHDDEHIAIDSLSTIKTSCQKNRKSL